MASINVHIISVALFALSVLTYARGDCDARGLNRCNQILAKYRQPGAQAATAEYCRRVKEAKACSEREIAKCEDDRTRSALYEGLRNYESLEVYCTSGRCSQGNVQACAKLVHNPTGRDEQRVCQAVAESMYCLRLAERECSNDEMRRYVADTIHSLQSAEDDCARRGYSVYRTTTPSGASHVRTSLWPLMTVIVLSFIAFFTF